MAATAAPAGTLAVRAVFGVKGNVVNNALFVDEASVVFPAGAFLVRHTLASRAVDLAPTAEHSRGVAVLALSTSRRFFAAAEAVGTAGAHLVSVYNTKTMTKRKSLACSAELELGERLQSLSFSADDQSVACVGTPPAFVVAVLSVDKGRAVARLALPGLGGGLGAPAAEVRPTTVAFAPSFGGKLCVWGRNAFQFFVLEEMSSSSEIVPASAKSSTEMTHLLTPIPHSPAFVSWAAPMMKTLFVLNDGAPSPNEHVPLSSSPLDLHTDTDQQRGASALLAPSSSFIAEGLTFTAFAWLTAGAAGRPDLNVAATRHGELLLFRQEVLLRVLAASPQDGRAIDILCATPSGGFISAGEAGCVRIFEQVLPVTAVVEVEDGPVTGGRNGSVRSASRGTSSRNGASDAFGPALPALSAETPSDYFFRLAKTLQAGVAGLECEDRIRSLSVSPSGRAAVLTLSGTQLLLLDLANALVKDDAAAFSSIGPLAHAPPVGQSAAPGSRADLCAVLSMSAAVRKPLIATVGADNTVRIWNFVERTCEVCKVYPEGPVTVALHPSGLQLLIGFADRLRLMNILPDDLREVKDFAVKGCSEARFSRGGHLFAAANGNVVQVYSAFSGEYLLTLRGHSGRILSVQWAYNDATLLSLATDGAVYEWDLKDGKRAREFTLKGAKFAAVASSRDGATLYTVGDGGLVSSSDGSYGGPGSAAALREVDFTLGIVTREWLLPAGVSGVSLSGSNPRMLFTASAEPGLPASVRSFAFPLIGASHSTPSGADFFCSAAPVARMLASHDDAYLFVAGEDGCVVVFDVRDANQRVPLSEYASKVGWAEETLVTSQDLEERRAAVRELRDAMAELQGSSQYNLRTKELAFQEAVRRETQRATTELEQLRAQADLRAEEKADSEVEFGERLAAAEAAHRSEMQKRESLYQTKIMDEVEKYQALQAEVGQQRARWQQRRAQSGEVHAGAVQRLMGEFERRLEAVRGRRTGLADDVEGGKRDWAEMRAQMEADLDEEALSTRRMYQERLDAERDAALKYKGENGIMRKKFSQLQHDIENSKEAAKTSLERLEDLRRTVEGLDRDIAQLRALIHNRDSTIGDRERRIYDLKKKNQELEKFKFVLDYKIKELKGQVEPREAEIAALRAQIKQVDAELEAYHRSNADLDGLIGAMRKELDELQASATNVRGSLHKHTAALRAFEGQLFAIVQAAKEPSDWADGAARLFHAHVPATLPVGSGDVSVIAESERQKEHLGLLAAELRRAGAANGARARADGAHLIEENLSLIAQIKSLRGAAAQLRLQLKTIAVEKARAVFSEKAAALQQQSLLREVSLSHGGGGMPFSATGQRSLREGVAMLDFALPPSQPRSPMRSRGPPLTLPVSVGSATLLGDFPPSPPELPDGKEQLFTG